MAKKAVTLDAPAAKKEGVEQGKWSSSRGIPTGSCVVHLYHADAVKLNDVVQVLGVISRVPELASGAMHGMEEEALASKIPTSVAPRIHAISVRKLDMTGISIAPRMSSVPELSVGGSATREGIVRYLANLLHGDTLAAEYVLMQLVSRVHRRPQGGVGLAGGLGQDTQAQLGMTALNITGVSGGEDKGGEQLRWRFALCRWSRQGSINADAVGREFAAGDRGPEQTAVVPNESERQHESCGGATARSWHSSCAG